MIAVWLASKAAVPIAIILAILMVILTIVCVTQAIEIHGWPIFGGGLKADIAALTDRIENPKNGYIANQSKLQNGLNDCNASIDNAAAKGRQQGAKAQAEVDAKKAGTDAAQKEAQRLLAIKPGANALATAYHVGLTGGAQ